MYALVDCNSFFCSCEKVFHPGLQGKPVCVLSSNDGIIVALTPEAKTVGLHRGDVLFKVQETIDRNNVTVFSSNMYLYNAMSKRIVSILRQSCDYVETYSIDESFLDLRGYERNFNLEDYMRTVAERVKLWTDIPVSIGVAPTKTLAKMGSKFAKNYKGYKSVCMIDSESKRRKALELFDLADIWGVGRSTYEKLLSLGVKTPLEFADKPVEWVHRHFTKPGFQTWCELNGHPCINTEEVLQKQTICTSHCFKDMVTSLDALKASVATFASSCAGKLRGQGSVATVVSVFIGSNPFREDLAQYWNGASVRLPVASCDTIEIAGAAIKILESVYRPGIKYKRSGVILSGICPDTDIQQNLFDPVRGREERRSLSGKIDELNHKFGLKTLRLAVEDGEADHWKSKSEHRSPDYLTDINEILTVQAE